MDHLADSLDSRREEVPTYQEASPMHLRLDKHRPTDPGALNLAQDRQAMERKVMQSMVNEQKH